MEFWIIKKEISNVDYRYFLYGLPAQETKLVKYLFVVKNIHFCLQSNVKYSWGIETSIFLF